METSNESFNLLHLIAWASVDLGLRAGDRDLRFTRLK